MRGRSRSTLAFVALAVVAAVSSAAHGGEEQKYDLRRRDGWRAGQVVTATFSASQRQVVKTSRADGTVSKDAVTASSTDATWVERVVEVDDRGDVTKATVAFKEWSQREQDEADTSLRGATVEVVGKGSTRRWRLVGTPAEPTAGAKAWLDARFGADDGSREAVRLAYLPKAPVALGESFALDPSALVASSAACLPADAAKARATGTLSSVEGGRAKVSVSVSLPLTGLPCVPGAPAAPWTSGGTLVLDGERWLTLDGSPLAHGHSTKGRLEGTVAITGPGGSGTLSVTQEMSETFEVVPGDEAAACPK